MGRILKIMNEHTRACGGVCVLADEERCGLGSKVQFMCEKSLKTSKIPIESKDGWFERVQKV